MREIKFRAWDMKWKRWIAPEDICVYGDGTADFQRRGENGEVMQYTGLKDKNGRGIYEGDILNRIVDLPPFAVEWSGDFAAFILHAPVEVLQFLTRDWIATHEVIGNIYENPELAP